MLDVLLIEESIPVVQAARSVLSRDGWKISQHSDGQGGIEMIRQVKPRLVILGLLLPHRSGAEILHDLRRDANASLALTPVVLLTFRRESSSDLPLADAVLSCAYIERDLASVVRRLLQIGGNLARVNAL